MGEHERYIEANRAAWNETAGIHERTRFAELLAAVAEPGFSTLDEVEREVFAGLGLAGKAVAQLSCNNARELLSLKLAGAGRCVGFDLSDAFIEQGRRLAQAAGAQLELVRGSVYDIPRDFDAAFDLVYVTVGALGWLPDLGGYLGVVERLLKPGGALFVYEMHPVLDMFDPSADFAMSRSYFDRSPDESADDPDYFDPSQRVSATSYWFHHTLGDILGGCLRRGLRLERFEEYGHDISSTYRALAERPVVPPMCYALVARKPG